jgi:hypothetical protein
VSDTFVNDPPALPGPAASWAPGEKPVGDANSILPQSDFMGDVKGHDAQIGVVQGQLAGAAEKAKTRGSFVDDQAADRAETYQQEMEHSYSLERASANDPSLKPWNADKEHSERVRGPIEQFGSLGTIFAMAASAFTRQPMVSALNAGAAAMTAMKNADEEGYKHAFEAWKDNSQLAIKRFDMERTMFDDVNKLATSNVALWRQKRAAVAAQFDDQKTLTLLQNGMDPEVLKLDAQQAITHGKLLENQKQMLQMNREQELYSDYIKAHMPEAKTPLDQLKVKAEALQAVVQSRSQQTQRSQAPDQQQYDMIKEKYKNDPDKVNKIAEEFDAYKRGQRQPGGGPGGAGTRPGSVNDDRVKMDADIRKEHPDWSDKQVIEERNKNLKASTTSLTGNEKEKIETRINKFARSDEIIDKTIKVLETHPGSAGIAGKIMRVEERLSNMVSAGQIKNSDRVQMMRDIELLRGWAKELLFSSNSKLKKEAERVDSIVAGTSAGDTGPNTIRALRDLKNMYDQMRAEDEAKLGGTWKAPVAGESKPAPTSGKTPWSKDPIVSP